MVMTSENGVNGIGDNGEEFIGIIGFDSEFAKDVNIKNLRWKKRNRGF